MNGLLRDLLNNRVKRLIPTQTDHRKHSNSESKESWLHCPSSCCHPDHPHAVIALSRGNLNFSATVEVLIEAAETAATLFVIPGIDLPVRLLPILMGLSMIVQQRMTPMTMDPAQAKMMMTIMPVMMTVLFYQFPSGLVLYWMISNVLGIAHQAWVGKQQRAAA